MDVRDKSREWIVWCPYSDRVTATVEAVMADAEGFEASASGVVMISIGS